MKNNVELETMLKAMYCNLMLELDRCRKIYREDRSNMQMRCAVEHLNGRAQGIRQTAELLGITL